MKIPREVEDIIKELNKNKFEAYVVGGCVRDFLLEKEPNDWDIATNAKPEEITSIFPNNYYENNFGTVTVITKNEKYKEIEITPYRNEKGYSDKRHPDEVFWVSSINEDLSRRDFTINAMAMNLDYKIIDPFGGENDLDNKIIKAVGDPDKRFNEDALRMMRAIRFSTTLDWEIENETLNSIIKNSHLLENISEERIRDELLKIVNSNFGAKGIEKLRRAGLLKYIIPELEDGFGILQNKHHIYQIYQHGILSFNYTCEQDFSEEVRLASLFHDIGKFKTKRGEGESCTFYNHEVVGAKITKKVLERLKFSKKKVEKIVKLVRYHLFYYNVDEVGESSVRRLLRNVGKENIEDLMQVRWADRIGSGVPKAEPYKLRHLKYLFEKVSQDPINPGNLKIDGGDIMKILKIKPGPRIGWILNILLKAVLDDPIKNNRGYLEKKIEELGKLKDDKLKGVYEKSRKDINEIETKRDEMTRKKYWVS